MAVLPPHKWRLSVIIPVTDRELEQMAGGAARSFKVRVPPAEGDVTISGYGVFCERCQLQSQDMSKTELRRCRGEDPDEVEA